MVSVARKRAAETKKTLRTSKEINWTMGPNNDVLMLKTAEQTPVPEGLTRTDNPLCLKNAEGQNVAVYTDIKGEVKYLAEPPEQKWPWATVAIKKTDDLDPRMKLESAPVRSAFEYGISPAVDQIFKNMASAFEWVHPDDETDPNVLNSPYYAENPSNPYHETWKKAQEDNNKLKVYAESTLPLNLQAAKEKGETFDDAPASSSSRPAPKEKSTNTKGSLTEEQKRTRYGDKECGFWPLGKCRDGDNCKYLHPPEKAPKLGAVPTESNVCWFWKRNGSCRNGDSCKYGHFE